MYNRYENNNQVYNFVKSCLPPERLEYWKNISQPQSKDLVEVATPQVQKVFLESEKYPDLTEKYRPQLEKLELLAQNPECGFDAFLYNRLANCDRYETTRNSLMMSKFFQEKEMDFFESENAIADSKLKPLKNIKNYAKKLIELLEAENQLVFTRLLPNAFGCYFNSRFGENLFFSVDKMNLLPSFVKWRNSHLVEWFIEFVELRKAQAYKEFRTNLLMEEIHDANRELDRSYYEYFEDKIRTLFEMNTNVKLLLVQQSNDLVPGTNLEIKKIIIVRYQDYRSVFKPEVEFTISVDNFNSEVEELKIALSGE